MSGHFWNGTQDRPLTTKRVAGVTPSGLTEAECAALLEARAALLDALDAAEWERRRLAQERMYAARVDERRQT